MPTQPAKPASNSNFPITWLILLKTQAPLFPQLPIPRSLKPLLTFHPQILAIAQVILHNVVDTKAVVVGKTVAASAAAVVAAVAVVHVVKSALLLPMKMATSFPKKWSSSTAVQKS